MATIIEKAQDAISSRMPSADPRLTTLPASGSVGGFVIWDGFANLDPRDRQDRLWESLRDRLSIDEQKQLTAIFTLTPEEYELTQDDES